MDAQERIAQLELSLRKLRAEAIHYATEGHGRNFLLNEAKRAENVLAGKPYQVAEGEHTGRE